MSNAPKPAPGWWINFLKNWIIHPWMAFKRKMRAVRSWLWRMIKAPFRLLSSNRKEVIDEVSDTALDAIPDQGSIVDLEKPGTGRHRAENIRPDVLLVSTPPATTSGGSLAADSADAVDSIIPDLPTGGHGGGGGMSLPDLDGCFDGCGDGCDGCDGFAFDLMMMTLGVVAIGGAVLYRVAGAAIRRL